MVLEEIKEITLEHSHLFVRSDGIIQLNTSDHNYSIADIKEIVAATGKLTDGKKALLLLVASDFTMVDFDVRRFMATNEAVEYSIAEAYVINSLAQKMLLNFFIQFDKPPVPTKFFKSIDDAVKWLHSLKTN